MNVILIVIQVFVLLFAITVHEAAHGWAAKKCGDATAFNMGRVTLNPLAHIDPFGTIIVPLLLAVSGLPAFGWAKPVPVNPRNFRNPKRDMVWTSFAGPGANLSVAFGAMVVLVLMKVSLPAVDLYLKGRLRGMFGGVETILGGGFRPLEGLVFILLMTVLINSYFAVFNLIPVPPLDGSGILIGLLPEHLSVRIQRIPPIAGFLIILLLINFHLLDIIMQLIFFPIAMILG